MLYLTSFTYLPYILDEKTKPKNNKSRIIETKYNLLFCFANVFCFLFLDKIRKSRKVTLYKNRILNYDQCFVRTFGFEQLSNESKSDYLKMKRYLKLKELNGKL